MEKLYENPIRIELSENDLFVDGVKKAKTTRTVREMINLFMERPVGLENFPLYYMYRNVFKAENIRFDITYLLPGTVGNEYIKTHGHNHPKSPDGLVYPEIYQVLRGNATFLFQKRNTDQSMSVAIVDTQEGDVVLIPPAQGHVTINAGQNNLILSNLVCDNFESEYDEYKQNHGAAYYYLENGQLIQNTNYIVKNLERASAAVWNISYDFFCKDLLLEFHQNPKKFNFLERPREFFESTN